MVLVISPYSPRALWPLGRVIEVFPGKVQHVCVAKMQEGHSTVVGHILKCILLESG